MDWLEWSSSVIGSVAWPAVLLISIFLFRKELQSFLKRLKKASIAGTTLEMALDNAEDSMNLVEKAQPDSPIEDAEAKMIAKDEIQSALSPMPGTYENKFSEALINSPNFDPAERIEQMWREVEQFIKDGAKDLGVAEELRTGSAFVLAKHLTREGLFTNQMMAMLGELRRVRNMAVHNSEEVTAEAVRRFYNLSVRFIALVVKLVTVPPESREENLQRGSGVIAHPAQ